MTPEQTAFIESLRVRGQSASTRASRAEALRTFFRWLEPQGITDVREVTRERVIAYQLWMQTRYQPQTVSCWMSGLRRFFEYLEKTDVILINPCLGVLLPRIGKRLPKAVLTETEARKILDQPNTQTQRGLRDKAILELLYSTGIRGEEMAGLTIHDVDCKNGFVRVTKGKFAKDRMVPMGRKAADYVSEYLSKVRALWSRTDRDERALWLSSKGNHQPLKYAAIALMVKNYAKTAGIDRPGRTHIWRHTCATHLVSNGANIAYVQRLLGHRSLRTTQKYTRVTISELKAAHRKTHPRKPNHDPRRLHP